MDESNIIQLINYLKEKYNSEINNIYYSLELLLESVNQIKYVLQNSTGINMDKLEYSERMKAIMQIQETDKYVKDIQSLENILNSYLNLFIETEVIKENIEEDNTDDIEDEKLIPNYQDYQVNSDIPHLLTESFKYKKVCGFMIDGVYHNVNNWKQCLKNICEFLIAKDPQKFSTLVNNEVFQGTKIKIFSHSDNNNKYYLKLDNADIYVWTNRSANDICSIIRKLLIQYSIPINSLYIYLRADYTSLHNGAIKINKQAQSFSENDEIKIGEFVRQSMRKLSDSHYTFTKDMLSNLQNPVYTKTNLGIGLPFLRRVKNKNDLSAIIKNDKGQNRYWKEIFKFNGIDYVINSQWTKNNAERFHKWFNSLPNKNL